MMIIDDETRINKRQRRPADNEDMPTIDADAADSMEGDSSLFVVRGTKSVFRGPC